MPPNERVQLWGDAQPIPGVASAAILPGSLVEIITAAGATQGQLRHHPTAAARTAVLIADAAYYVGKGIADAYVAGDHVGYYAGTQGHLYQMRLAASQTVVAGQELESAGDGSLRVQAAAGIPLFQAEQAVTTTATPGYVYARVL